MRGGIISGLCFEGKNPPASWGYFCKRNKCYFLKFFEDKKTPQQVGGFWGFLGVWGAPGGSGDLFGGVGGSGGLLGVVLGISNPPYPIPPFWGPDICGASRWPPVATQGGIPAGARKHIYDNNRDPGKGGIGEGGVGTRPPTYSKTNKFWINFIYFDYSFFNC